VLRLIDPVWVFSVMLPTMALMPGPDVHRWLAHGTSQQEPGFVRGER